METHPELKKALLRAGLLEKETEVYLALLRLGASHASTIAEKIDLPRSTVQFTCQQLVKKRLAVKTEKGNSYVFLPEPPEKILFGLRRERHELEEAEDQVERMMGELKALMDPQAVLPKVRYFEGAKSVIEGYEILLEKAGGQKEILSFLHALDEVSDIYGLTDDFEKITLKMEELQIYNRILSPPAETAIVWQKKDKPGIRETRLMKSGAELQPTEILFAGHTMYAMAVEKNRIFGFMSENQSIVSMLKLSFELLWDACAPS